MNDLVTWLDQQMENQRHTGAALNALAAAQPPETGALLTEVGDFLIRDASAKRLIMEIHGTGSDPCDAHDANLLSIPCDTLLALALPFAGRPGYREEWRP